MAAATASTAAHLLRSSSLKLKQPLSLPFTDRRGLPTQPLRFSAAFASAHLLHSSSPKLKQPRDSSPKHKPPRSRCPPIHKQPRRFSWTIRRPAVPHFFAAPKISDTISVGHKLPDATLSYLDATDKLQTVSIADLTANKRAILVAVQGAFTPTCSHKHLPGFVENAAEFKAKGVDTIACVSVNDAFVMKAWKADLKIGEEVLLLSDVNGDFTRAIGCELDLSDKPIGLGVTSRRYAMFVEYGFVRILNMEDGAAFNVSSAEELLKAV